MAQVINTNIASLNAQRNLNTSQGMLGTSLQRLSSGLRINSAKDDAAGLAISERFTAQIRGLNQAARNSNDGISLAQTAEGSLGELTNNLQRIRELGVQSSNATNSASDRVAMQAEVTQLLAEVNRVSAQTNFNGVALLDGSFLTQAFQVGANVGETISVSSIIDATTTGLGLSTASASVQGTAVTGAIVGNGDLTINGVAVTAAADDAKSVAAAISAVANVAATASTSVTMGAFTAGSGGTAASIYSLTVGTVSIVHNGPTVSLVDLDTALSDATVQANLAAAGITTTGTFAGTDMTFIDADGDDIDLAQDATTGVAYGVGNVPTFAGLAANTVGSVAVTSTNEDLVIAGTGVALAGLGGVGVVGTTTTDPDADQNVLTVADANSLITAVDTALDLVNSARGTLGAIQNRFESVVTSLQISTESLSAARSRIQDTDFAAETANLTKAQILQQAGIAMIAQANSLPQNVLSLLQ